MLSGIKKEFLNLIDSKSKTTMSEAQSLFW